LSTEIHLGQKFPPYLDLTLMTSPLIDWFFKLADWFWPAGWALKMPEKFNGNFHEVQISRVFSREFDSPGSLSRAKPLRIRESFAPNLEYRMGEYLRKCIGLNECTNQPCEKVLPFVRLLVITSQSLINQREIKTFLQPMYYCEGKNFYLCSGGASVIIGIQ
jgi:hypothetical protein